MYQLANLWLPEAKIPTQSALNKDFLGCVSEERPLVSVDRCADIRSTLAVLTVVCHFTLLCELSSSSVEEVSSIVEPLVCTIGHLEDKSGSLLKSKETSFSEALSKLSLALIGLN